MEWVLECTVERVHYTFEGVSTAIVRDGRIEHLREYRTIEPLFEAEV